MQINDRKALLRKEMKALRKQLDPAERQRKDSAILAAFLKNERVMLSDTVLLYISNGSEPDTYGIMKACAAAGKKTAAPRCSPDNDGIMSFYYINGEADLEKGAYGIYEPTAACVAADKAEMRGSVLVVPGLCFNAAGYRLGYGKGYYDRFLKDYNGFSIGLCYRELMTEDIPVGRFDLAVDMIITD